MVDQNISISARLKKTNFFLFALELKEKQAVGKNILATADKMP